jgi:hypothetical protein
MLPLSRIEPRFRSRLSHRDIAEVVGNNSAISVSRSKVGGRDWAGNASESALDSNVQVEKPT